MNPGDFISERPAWRTSPPVIFAVERVTISAETTPRLREAVATRRERNQAGDWKQGEGVMKQNVPKELPPLNSGFISIPTSLRILAVFGFPLSSWSLSLSFGFQRASVVLRCSASTFISSFPFFSLRSLRKKEGKTIRLYFVFLASLLRFLLSFLFPFAVFSTFVEAPAAAGAHFGSRPF